MDTKYMKKPLVELFELKRNLRLDADVEDFDGDLTVKLDAAIAAAGSFIGRDLNQVPVYSYPYAERMELNLDPALHVDFVSVGSEKLDGVEWAYVDGTLTINVVHRPDETVEVKTAYRSDIRAAVLMHASSLWLSPADSVETLPKASTNLLSQYRQYGRRH
jgi:hypothetical protein